MNVKEVGILFVYLSYDNANTNPVYFDELKITYAESPVIQVNAYYDVALGRWFAVDPKGQFLTLTQEWEIIRPILDPDGKFAFVPLLIGAAISVGCYYRGDQCY